MNNQRQRKITKKLETEAGCIYLTKKQVCKILGYSRQSIDVILYGLPRFNKKFLSDDIAERIVESETWNC